jgi:tRNA modification GTPase
MAKVALAEDTIAAIATPWGEGAIGIVRLSGLQATAIVDKVFLAKNKKPILDSKTFSLRYGWIAGDRGVIVDEVVVSLMRAPKSYTREDVVEINSHGGARPLALILELVLANGARMAEPGEFTKRAFLNGRLDLAQAEAVLDIIRAKSDLALKNSLSQLSGTISRQIKSLRKNMLEILADMEASVDFSEEDISAVSLVSFQNRLFSVNAQLKDLIERGFKGKIIRDGLKVVIFGKPNVGKSSLLNALLKQERAIVTSIAGTTRDTIEEYINIKGLAVQLIDTAGMLKHRNKIEKEALLRTRKALHECDLVLFVLDGSSALTKEDWTLAQQIKDKKVLVVVNKSDKKRRIKVPAMAANFSKPAIEVSALKGKNIEVLEEAIYRTVFDGGPFADEGAVVSNARHMDILKKSLMACEAACATLAKKLSLEFVALDLRKAVDGLGALTGEVFSDKLLDVIFSKFCIGK